MREKIELWLKVGAFVITLGTFIWNAGALKEELKRNYDFLSYQMGELSKQVANDRVLIRGDMKELRRRTEAVEKHLMDHPRAP